jgi:hypothetical protein
MSVISRFAYDLCIRKFRVVYCGLLLVCYAYVQSSYHLSLSSDFDSSYDSNNYGHRRGLAVNEHAIILATNYGYRRLAVNEHSIIIATKVIIGVR